MIKMLKVLILSAALVMGITGTFAQVVYAAPPTQADCDSIKTKKFLGVPAWYRYLTFTPNTVTNQCEITATRDGNVVLLIMLAVVSMLMGLAAIVAVVFVVYGGVLLVISQGTPDKIAAARKTILNAVIGLVIVLLSSQIVQYVAKWLSTP